MCLTLSALSSSSCPVQRLLCCRFSWPPWPQHPQSSSRGWVLVPTLAPGAAGCRGARWVQGSSPSHPAPSPTWTQLAGLGDGAGTAVGRVLLWDVAKGARLGRDTQGRDTQGTWQHHGQPLLCFSCSLSPTPSKGTNLFSLQKPLFQPQGEAAGARRWPGKP